MRALGVIGVAALTGCSLLFGDELSGDSSNAAPGTEGGVDARLDGAVPRLDGGASGTDDGVDAAAPFCASHPGVFFCDDFDLPGDTIQSAFTDDFVHEQGVTFDIVGDRFVSGPKSVRIVTPTLPANGDSSNRQHPIDFGGPKTKITIEYSLFLDAVPGKGSGRTPLLSTIVRYGDNASLNSRLNLVEQATGNPQVFLEEAVYTDTPDGYFNDVPVDIPFHQWTHLVRTLDFTAFPAKESIFVDDHPAINVTHNATFNQAPTSGAVTLGFEYTNGPADGWTIYVDNILLDAH
jgi:hypothetical protein